MKSREEKMVVVVVCTYSIYILRLFLFGYYFTFSHSRLLSYNTSCFLGAFESSGTPSRNDVIRRKANTVAPCDRTYLRCALNERIPGAIAGRPEYVAFSNRHVQQSGHHVLSTA